MNVWQRLRTRAGTVPLEEWLFYAAFALCAVTTLLVRTTFSTILFVPKEVFEPVGYALSALLLLAKLALEREASWRYLLAVALVVVGFTSFWVALAWRFSVLFLFVAAGKGVSIKPLAAIVLAIHLAVFAVTLGCALLGVIDSIPVYRMVDGHWKPRWSYGYSHPNMLGEVCLTIACAWAVLRFPRFRVADAVVFAATGLCSALLVGARTATVCIVFAALLAALSPAIVASQKRARAASVGALALFVSLAALSLFMMVAYDDAVAWMHRVDQALSTRFSLAHRFYEIFSPRAFGRAIMAVKTEEILQLAPDNAYARAVVKQGIVPALVLGLLCLSAYLRCAYLARWDACTFGLVVYAVVAVMEMYATNFTLNYFLLACSAALFEPWCATRAKAPCQVERGSA